MRKVFFNVSYIGTNLRGVSKDVREIGNSYDSNSITGLLELALADLFPKNQPDVYVSSRTDAGVHAVSNSAHFILEEPEKPGLTCGTITHKVNRFLEKIDTSIRVKNVQFVPEEFHSRYSAKSRTYLYRFAVLKPEKITEERHSWSKFVHPIPILERNRCLFINNPNFDEGPVHRTTKLLTGTHDFSTFMSSHSTVGNADKNTVRTIYDLRVRPGHSLISPSFDPAVECWNFWELFCHGRSFLYKQVRRLLSTILAVGQGKISEEFVQQMLDCPGKDSWSSKIFLVPSDGLYLLNVEYDPDDLIFKSDEILEARRKKLRATETKVTLSDGRVFVEKLNEAGERVVAEQEFTSVGFVVDNKPDLQIGCVLPGLLVGSQDVAVDQSLLKLHKVTHILSVGVPDIRVPVPLITHRFLDLLDLPESRLEEKLTEACLFIENGLAGSGGCVFVHCNAGVSRAPTVIIGFLIKCRGMKPEEALQLVKEKRPSVKPNEGFWRQLVQIYQNKS